MPTADGPRALPADLDDAAPAAAPRRGRSVLAAAGFLPVLLLSWLLLGALPVAADGGPHVVDANSGTWTLTTATCARCHRAHTASSPMLLDGASDDELCLNCHGAAGIGATTDVEDGVQLASANDGTGNGPVAGALRAGGFVDARIDAGNPSRISFPRLAGPAVVADFSSLVPVLAVGVPVTSAHLDLGQPGIDGTATAWGNGALDAASPTVSMGCATCHNPHGNGQYRILRPIPHPATAPGSPVAFVEAGADAPVTDLPLPVGAGAAGTRNYTVQWGRTLQDVLDAAAGPTAGDYWRRYLPWDEVPGWSGVFPVANPNSLKGDRPEFDPALANLDGWVDEISLWCAACHSRYLAGGDGATTDSGDDTYRYRHATVGPECTQCHVSHGSNAAMGPSSAAVPYPDATASDSSRLLKVDNRGTCQQCHDPTGTVPFTNQIDSP